jgi:hypothetical protein
VTTKLAKITIKIPVPTRAIFQSNIKVIVIATAICNTDTIPPTGTLIAQSLTNFESDITFVSNSPIFLSE